MAGPGPDGSLGQTAGLNVKILPSVHSLTSPNVRVADIRDIELADFLDRDEVEIDDAEVGALLEGKSILVTGAGGSIGSVLCSTIMGYKPGRLIMLDHDENALHRLQLVDQAGNHVEPLVPEGRVGEQVEHGSVLGNVMRYVCKSGCADLLTRTVKSASPDSSRTINGSSVSLPNPVDMNSIQH